MGREQWDHCSTLFRLYSPNPTQTPPTGLHRAFRFYPVEGFDFFGEAIQPMNTYEAFSIVCILSANFATNAHTFL